MTVAMVTADAAEVKVTLRVDALPWIPELVSPLLLLPEEEPKMLLLPELLLLVLNPPPAVH